MTTFLHLLIVCVAAPALGVAACDVLGAWNYGRILPERIPGALAGGFVALFFIWFATVPLGLISYLLFRALARKGVFSWSLWLGCGAALGVCFGWLLGRGGILSIVLIIGCVVGVIKAAVLRFIWRRETARVARPIVGTNEPVQSS